MLTVTLALCIVCAEPLGAGNHVRSIECDGLIRSYRIHVPAQYNPAAPTPVVLAYHGAMMNGLMLSTFSGLNSKADEAGFVAVYPNGSGVTKVMLFWNAGLTLLKGRENADDVAFTARLLDDLSSVINVDSRRVYATGLSNGGMMCYRLAAELSDRIAAIAPIAGTMALDKAAPKRPVPVIHFHGTEDKLVRYDGPDESTPRLVEIKSVVDTMRVWCRINDCAGEPEVAELPDTEDDGTTVTRTSWGRGNQGAEVVLYTIRGGGHTWPGQTRNLEFLGKSTTDISANDLMWEFFQRHPLIKENTP